ncbi:MAG: hypothetical protein U9Q07_06740 [Planctomycetota bacterium]|nr:hypothetical protein [Planctomycetota bacterium]
MKTYDFVHLSLYALGGNIKGKTKLQKTIYFLGILTNHLDELGYCAHYYGPYSSDVAEAANRLRSLDFLEQTVMSGGAIDSRGFEVARYDFSLNNEGKDVAELKKKRYSTLSEDLDTAVRKFRTGEDIDYQALSIAAKTHFLLEKKGGKATVTEIEKIARKFGWSVDKTEIEKATCFLEEIGLVETAQTQ